MTTPPPEPSLLYIIKQVELAVRARLDELMRPVGMTAVKYTALTVLERRAHLTSAQLARNSFVTAQAMSDMVSALISQGLVRRGRDPHDRRRLVLELTDDGRALLLAYRDKVAALEETMLAGISGRDTTDLRRILLTCRHNLADMSMTRSQQPPSII